MSAQALQTPPEDTEVFPSIAATHVHSDDRGAVVIRQGAMVIKIPQQLASDLAHFILEAGRGDR